MSRTGKILYVTKKGAVPGSGEIQTEAFQKALDDVWKSGGGEVRVPEGKYIIGGIRIRSNTTLRLMQYAEIYGVRDPSQYGILREDRLEPLPADCITEKGWERGRTGVERDNSFFSAESPWSHGLIRAYGAQNVAVIGDKTSVIDGCNCFDGHGEEGYRGPHGISFYNCKGVTFEGYTIRNTGNWAHCLFYCEDIRCHNVTVLAGHDGIHIRDCRNTRITGCVFRTGDDCVAGFGNFNTYVSECLFNTACSGLRFGGTKLLCENCDFEGPGEYLFRGSLTKEEKEAGAPSGGCGRRNMLSVFTYFSGNVPTVKYAPGGLYFINCRVKNVDRFMHYNYSGSEFWQMGRPLSNVIFRNITAEGIKLPLCVYGDREEPLTMSIENSELSFDGDDGGLVFMKAANVRGLRMKNVKISGNFGKEMIRSWGGIGDVSLENVDFPSAGPVCADAEEEFSVKGI